jgi:hypothetical protein
MRVHVNHHRLYSLACFFSSCQLTPGPRLEATHVTWMPLDGSTRTVATEKSEVITSVRRGADIDRARANGRKVPNPDRHEKRSRSTPWMRPPYSPSTRPRWRRSGDRLRLVYRERNRPA